MNKNINNKEQIKISVVEKYDTFKNKFLYLENFRKRNESTKYINKRMYHLLYKPETFINAYKNISKNKGALTKGIKTDNEAILFFGLEHANLLCRKFTTKTYKWFQLRRTWIPKPGKKKMRPIDTPTQEDRIVQEAIRGILEAIFEPEFKEFEKITKCRCSNYEFRQGKSCFQAVDNLKKYGQNTNVVIERDISSAYNSINHKLLLREIGKRIKDKQFLKLIKELLQCGIMDKHHYIDSLTGTPQGGIALPLLPHFFVPLR